MWTSRISTPFLGLALAAAGLTIVSSPALAATPELVSDTGSVATEHTLELDLAANDNGLDDTPLTFELTDAGALGDAVIDPTSGELTYTALTDPGTDYLSYQVTDADGESSAADVTIQVLSGDGITSSGPLTRVASDADLNCSVNHQQDSSGEFYQDTACGTFLVVDDEVFSPDNIPAGSEAVGTPWTPVSQAPVAGSGTQADPFRLVTTVAAGGTGVTLTQTDSYVVGQESYRTTVKIDNGGAARDVRLYRAADCYLADSDNGRGAVDAETGAVACVSPSTDRIEQWLPLSPGSRYFEAEYGEVWQAIADKGAFPNTCRCDEEIDNGAGLSWDISLPANGTATRASLITFSPLGALPLTTEKVVDDSSVAPGDEVTYTITVRNPGEVDANLVDIRDTLPDGFSYVAGSTTGATTANPTTDGDDLVWPAAISVPAQGSVTLAFSATAADAAGEYPNNATADAVDLFVNPTGDTAVVEVEQQDDTTPPGPVTDLTATPGDGQVDLSWTNPTDADFASLTLVYLEGDVAPTTPDEGTAVPVIGPDMQAITVPDLTNGTTYSFTIFANDTAGNHSDGASASATPQGDVAAVQPVTNLQAAGAGSGSAVLTWLNPDELDGIIVRYSTDAYPDSPTDGTGVPVTGKPETVTVDGLTDGATIYFSVFATLGAEASEAAMVEINPFSCPDLTPAMSAASGLVSGQEWIACSSPTAHDPANALDSPLPRVGPTQALMTNGDREVATPPDDGGGEGADNHTGSRGAHDVSIYRIDLQVPNGSSCLQFDYVFASEEYPEYVGESFNDGFLAQLDQNEWSVDGDSSITATGNFARLAAGEFVSVNSPVFADQAKVSVPPANGTGYDGMSVVLTASTPITSGAHSIYLSIFDAGDGILDSAALIDNLRVTDLACSAGSNQAPVAVDDAMETAGTSPVTKDLVANDTDGDGHALTVSEHADPAHGSVTCTATSCTYTAEDGFMGTDSFDYTVSDGHGGTDTGTVTVTVSEPAAISAIDIALSRDLVTWPAKVTVSGTVEDGVGAPVAGVEVELWQSVGNTSTKVATLTSDSDGMVAKQLRPKTRTTYVWKVVTPAVESDPATVRVRPVVTMRANHGTVAVNYPIRFYGASTPTRHNTPVKLQLLKHGHWVTVKSTTIRNAVSTLGPTGSYSLRFASHGSGTFKFRTLVPADAGREAATSPIRTIRVYAAQVMGVSRSHDEHVTIKNTGHVNLNLRGWKLVNKSGHRVTLSQKSLAPRAWVRIHTGRGRNSAHNLYLHRSPMFSNRHDVVRLLDNHGVEVDRFRY